MRRFWIAAAAAATLLPAPSRSDDWARFRGPNGSGVSAETAALPDTWSDTEHLQWKLDLPGPGSSSAIVIGEKVFLTCWSGYGAGPGNPGSQSDLRRHLLCVDLRSGKILWDRKVEAVLPEDRYGGMFAEHGYASHTPVSDGERVYVFFGKSGVLAFDMEGQQLWQTSVGTELDPRGWGSACSPILHKDLVIVTASAESQAVYGLDKQTGKEVWKQKAGGFASTWGTPVLVKIDEERTDLAIGVPYEIWGLNPDNGKLRWFSEAMATDSFCSSVVTEGGVVYGIEGRGGGSIAVRAGGQNDVSKSHVVWSGRDSNRIGTPVLYEGRLYFFAGDVVNCVDASTGKEVFRGRLTGAPAAAQPSGSGGSGNGGRRGGRGGSSNYSSPIVADGKLFYVSRRGDMYVLRAGDKFEQLAVNRVTSESEDFSASPSVSQGRLLVRSSKRLYCIGQ